MLPQMQAENADFGDAAAGPGRGPLELDIFDLLGKPVLSASIAQPWPKAGAAAVTLRTLNAPRTPDSGWLTICRASGPGNGVHIYDKDDTLFGCIKKDATQPRYVLSSNPGDMLLLFEGSFEEHRVNVLDDRRSMIAHAEPCKRMAFEPDGRFYQVRIAAAMDVGLVLSGLLSINAMEAR